MINYGNIAIDGPAGAGKSTVAQLLAEKLGYIYIDTGAMYRVITLKALTNKVSLDDHLALTRLAEETKIDFAIQKTDPQVQAVFCDGQDVTEQIRSPEVSSYVSTVAQIPGVRSVLLKQQKLLAQRNNVVMDGRDIGSRVLPDAPFKFFLTASVEERAKRRFLELTQKGYRVNEQDVIQEIIKRDKMDRERSIAPLVKAEDAIEIDTSHLQPSEVVELIVKMITSSKSKK